MIGGMTGAKTPSKIYSLRSVQNGSWPWNEPNSFTHEAALTASGK